MNDENQGSDGDTSNDEGQAETSDGVDGPVTEKTVEESTTTTESTSEPQTEEQVGVPDNGEPEGSGATDHGVASPDAPSEAQGAGSSEAPSQP